jgi:hypothetical protein
MKPFVVFALWAALGWDVGAWGEALIGIPSAVGILIGVAIGAGLALEVRRRIAAGSERAACGRSRFPAEALGAMDRAV